MTGSAAAPAQPRPQSRRLLPESYDVVGVAPEDKSASWRVPTKRGVTVQIPPPPTPPPSSKNSLLAWITRHKFASTLIGVFALIVLASVVGNTEEQASSSKTPLPSVAARTSSQPTSIIGSGDAAPEKATVPQLVGLSFKDARLKLDRAGFTMTIAKKYSHESAGTVLTTSTKAGSRATVGNDIVLTIAQPYPTVPYLVGLSETKAIAKVKAAGYSVVMTRQESSQRAGTVISSNPGAGSDRLPGQKVVIIVAKAPPAPPPSQQPSSGTCTSGYSPCLPPASDYDCAGGSGDGPEYVYGTVRVTGSDPYGLDSDNDGYGCE